MSNYGLAIEQRLAELERRMDRVEGAPCTGSAVLARVREEINWYVAHVGRKPTRVYLGTAEMAALGTADPVPPPLPAVFGLDMYAVKAQYHLRVA